MGVQETKVTVPKITEEAMEEADYEVVETTDPSTTSSAFPPTPQNSFASLPSLPSGQLDDGFEAISQRAEEPASLLNVDNAAATVVESKDLEEEEESPIANLKPGVEALLTDLSVDNAAGPEKEEETSSNILCAGGAEYWGSARGQGGGNKRRSKAIRRHMIIAAFLYSIGAFYSIFMPSGSPDFDTMVIFQGV